MAALTLGYRHSITESFDDNHSRYIPSSVYSGPGPEVDAPPAVQPVQPVQPMYSTNGGSREGQNGFRGVNGFSLPFTHRPRNSDALNLNDPVAMHLLTETALGDSRNFEILSFEELEQLKIEKARLRNKIQTIKRKIGLETKLRDAAQSLNRLYSKAGRDGADVKGHRRNLTGSSKASDMSSRAEDEYTASNRKIEELGAQLESLKDRLDDNQRRILEHTAGILQMTHRGLKKNLRKNELPRSPESMASPGQRSISGGPVLDEFDERSLYPVPDYVNEFIGASPMTPMLMVQPKTSQSSEALNGMAQRLQELSQRLHGMAAQMQSTDRLPEPPMLDGASMAEIPSKIDAQLAFLSHGLESLAVAQQRSVEESTNATTRINNMLERTRSIGRSPDLVQDEAEGNGLTHQLAFSAKTLEQLQSRVDTLVNQKDILTRQIQQQRELNSKSDAQRDAHIQELTQQVEDFQNQQANHEAEAHRTRDEISQLMDQLDRARDDNQSREQQKDMSDNKALAAEREARKQIEDDFGLRLQNHTQQLKEMSQAREQAEMAAQSHKSDAEKLLEQIASIQTELVMTKAELDSAYGSRAQRAADVSSNPVVQKQLDELQALNSQLQKELKDTIEDYEQMTKASIEFEKERDTFEASIDKLRDKCETLESQLNEEKLKSLGTKTPISNDTTSTTVLKNEFKKMMRDTKTESMKAIRHEQEERRKLEAIIRQMRKDTGVSTPTKSAKST